MDGFGQFLQTGGEIVHPGFQSYQQIDAEDDGKAQVGNGCEEFLHGKWSFRGGLAPHPASPQRGEGENLGMPSGERGKTCGSPA